MKVAIYCRLSEEDKGKANASDDSRSIQNQKSILIDYALSNNWEIYKIYSDDDYSGADRKRPEFNKMITDAEKKMFDIILCKSQSRFSRELEIVEKYIHGKFTEWGIRFIGVADNADTANAANKKSRQINGLVNEWYLEDMSENIKSVLTNRRKQGHFIGAFAPYGYKKDKNDHSKLIVDDEAAMVVKEIFKLYEAGHGKTAIARILNDRGIPNPTEYKRQKGLRFGPALKPQSTLWKYFAIDDILHNEVYIGNLVQGKYGSVSYKSKKNKPRPKEEWIKVENTHEAIISKELWNNVQSIIQKKTKPFTSGTLGIFAGKVKCMHCGYVMRSTKSHELSYLKCETKYFKKDACIGAFVPVKTLEETVLRELKQLNDIYFDTDSIESSIQINNGISDRMSILNNHIYSLNEKISEANLNMKSLYSDKTKGVIGEELFISLIKEYENDTEKLKKQLSVSLSELNNLKVKSERVISKKMLIEKYVNTDKLERETVCELIDCIYVGKRDPVTKKLPVEIHWNF